MTNEETTPKIKQNLFRYNIIKDKYDMELEQLKDIDNASRTLFNTSIAILTIETTLLTGLIIQNIEKIKSIGIYLTIITTILVILSMVLTLNSSTYFYKAKKINEQVIPIETKNIEEMFEEKENTLKKSSIFPKQQKKPVMKTILSKRTK